MKRAAIVVLTLCLAAGFAACKKGGGEYAALGKYAEAGPVLDSFISVNENFIAALNKAASADDVASALNACAEKMTDLAPKVKAIGEKFPEFKEATQVPDVLKPFNDRINAIMGNMFEAMQKAAPYMSDPKVQAAQQKYQEAMASME